MPRLIVFDLDLTLWHCDPVLWCDQLAPPVRLDRAGRVLASCRSEVHLYPDVPTLLEQLTDDGQSLAVASRTSAPAVARQLLGLLGIAKHFPHRHQEIYPGDKRAHFHSLHQETGIRFEDMLFFDDEPRNIESVSPLGVAAHLVHNGMTQELLDAALRR